MEQWEHTIKIGRKVIGSRSPCFIVAEAGVNHNGKTSIAKRLIDAAHKANADAIKFQTFSTEKLVSRELDRSQFDMLRRLELNEESHIELKEYSAKKGIIFFSTPFDEDSVHLLNRIHVPIFKISSGDMTNFKLLKAVARTKKPIIISTGMATLLEIRDSLSVLSPFSRSLILTHCTSLYPPSYEEVNLNAMDTIRRRFKVLIGYSDHTLGYEISLAAVALRACVIEKHLTVDKTLDGPDQRASLEPDEFADMVKKIRNIEKALGKAIKAPVPRELAVKEYARKSVISSKSLNRNHVIEEADIILARPAGGIEPRYFEKVIGKRVVVPIRKGHQVFWDMLT